MLLTTNILQKTFLIRQGNGCGTAFAIESGDREYLITARHVLPENSQPVDILHEEQWKPLPVTGIYHHPGGPDVAVMTLGQQIAPNHPAEPTLSGVVLGQEVLMVGFPFGWHHTQFNINNGYPIPFVKAAILSALIFKETTIAYLDGHNNPGFSGGPLLAEHLPSKNPKCGPKIIGVVSGFWPERTPHPSEIGHLPEHIGPYPVPEDHIHLANSGFILGYGINHVLEVVEANPYGFELAARRK